ncbi:MAG: hypothetical protein ABWZ87_10580 [Aeromicrobium sp.]
MSARRMAASRRVTVLLVTIVAVVMGTAVTAAADPDVTGDDDEIVFEDDESSNDQTGNGTGGGGDAVIRIPKPYKEYRYVPNCSANAPEGGADALCGGAVYTCPEPGDINYRVYTRQRNADGSLADGAEWEPGGLQCRGADDPPEGGPIEITTADIADEARKAAPVTVVHVEPVTTTFVNVPNNFYADDEGQDATVELLGQAIALRFEPTGFAWSFGDGSSGSGAGQEGAPVGGAGTVEHEYRRSGDVEITLTRTFEVTYTIPGGQTGVLPAPGVSNTSAPYALQVGEIQSTVTNRPR